MVKTIFYFADNLPFEDYLKQLRDGDIACRTIVFAKELKSIYMGGEMYGGWDDDMFRRVLIRVLNNDDVINALIQFIKNNRNDLPIATKTDLGAIMVGAFLAITENGSLSVDINSLFGDASTIDKIKNIIKNYFSQQDPTKLPVASKESFGIVKIGDGLDVTDGTISVDFDSMSNEEKGDLAEIVLNFIRTNSNFHASTTNYGVVRIAENGGISVNDGIIGVDTNTIVNNITNNNTFKEYVENAYDLPTASATQKGGVKIGSGLTMTGDVLSVNTDPSTGGIDYSITDLILTGTTLSIIQNGVSITEDLSSLVSAGADGKDGKDGQDGKDGKSAYEIAVENGFTGTVEEWLNSLKGQDGQNGTNGRDGQDGQDGKDGQDGRDGRDGVDGKDGQDGYTPTIDDQLLITVIEYVINNHEGGQQGGSEVDIEEIVNEVINVLNTKPWGEIFTSNGWSDAINAYLQQIGLIGQEVDEQGNRITKYNYSEMIQKLDEISSKVDSIELFTDEDGNMITIEDLYSRIDQTVNNHTAITALEAKLAQWETDGPVVESVWSTTVNKVSNLDNRLNALAEQQASVIDQDSYTLSLLHLTADETSSMASLTSSYGDYFFDEKGNPIYEEDTNGNVIYNRDEEGKAIPYSGVILKYLDVNGNELPDNHTIDQRVPYKKLVKNENSDEIAFQNLTDKNGNIIYRQRAIKVYYLADSNGNYIDNTQYVRVDDINNGDITWSINDNYKDIDGNSLKVINYSGNIAYHKKRKFKLRSKAGFITRSNAEDALSEQFAKYNDVQGLRNDLSTVSTKATANSAAVQAIARNTVYKSRTENDNGNPVISFLWRDDNGYEQWSSYDLSIDGYHKVVDTSSDAGLSSYVDGKIASSSIFADYVTSDALESKKYATVDTVTTAKNAAINATATATFYESRNNNDTIEFKWVKGDEVDWSADKPQGEGWSKVIREQNRAGLSSYVDNKIANSSLSSLLAGVRSEINTKVTLDDVNGAISSATINADKINLNGQTTFLNAIGDSITVKSLSATDGTSTVTANADGIKIEPTSSTTSVELKNDGSGSLASGTISWGPTGDVTIGGNTTIGGTLNGATGTFSGSLSGASGTFNNLSSANGNIQLKPTSTSWHGYNWMGVAIATNGDLSGDLATIGARINHGGYDYGRLVLVKRQTGTIGEVSYSNTVELNANDRSISASIIKDNAGNAVAMPNNIKYNYCTFPTYPVDGQFVFCIHCTGVSTGGLYNVYNTDYTNAGTTISYDEPTNLIFVFGPVPGTNSKGWHIFHCG